MRYFSIVAALATVVTSHHSTTEDAFQNIFKAGPKPPPNPEPIEVTELTLPPALANTTAGACTLDINVHGTGCISQSLIDSGSFLPDGKHVTASIEYVGAADGPAGIYSGMHFVLLKADGTFFPNGDPWKCVTCGVPAENQVGATILTPYPQTFRDGTRALAGNNIIDCGLAQLSSANCTPEKVHIYPIRFSNKVNDDGSGPGGEIRELRLHPDDLHLGFSVFDFSNGALDEYAYYGRLQFNTTSRNYDVVNVTILVSSDLPQPVSTNGKELIINPDAIVVGELRGFSGTGNEITYIGYPIESCNIDLFAADLTTGAFRRLTSHPEYVDPAAISPNDQWSVIMDTRGTNRQMWVSGLRNVPPITDLVSVTASASTRNNGERRFFEPWLLDRDGDRGLYFGQKITAAGDGSPGSINDPNWNGGADPRWSLDGTLISFFQRLAVAPACGGTNPLPCEVSPYPDGRRSRIMVAKLTSRQPLSIPSIPAAPDEVPWGTKYTPGMVIPPRSVPATGAYTLRGRSSGHADVQIVYNPNSATKSVSATYHEFSRDGRNFLNGFENVTSTALTLTLGHYDWFSNLTSTGVETGTKLTSPDGFHLDIDVMTNHFNANGTLTTTINGVSFYQPCNGC